MKKNLSLLFYVFWLFTSKIEAQDFITKWYFDTNATSLSFFAQTAGGAVNYTWATVPSGNSGSGSFTRTGAGIVTLSSLNILANDTVIIQFQPNNLRRFYFNGTGTNRLNIIDIFQWGSVPWSSMSVAFFGCENLDVTATDTPNLSGVTAINSMFRNCRSLIGTSSFNAWNTSSVENMNSAFAGASIFNQNISNWNTSNVTNFSSMFASTLAFNQPLNTWDTQNATNIASMFNFASAFNQPLDNWNVSNVTSFNQVFRGAQSFNQPIENWNTSNVTIMGSVFYGATSFNQPLNNWDMSKVTNVNAMFYRASSFNQPLDNWDMSSVTTMREMFFEANSFNQPIGNWDISKVVNLELSFANAKSFNQNLNNWDVRNVSSFNNMFFGASAFNQSLSNWTLTSANGSLFQMFAFSGIDCNNYHEILTGWLANPLTPNNQLFFGVQGLIYTPNTVSARNGLIAKGWNFIGDNLAANAPNLVAINNKVNAINLCGYYVNPIFRSRKMIEINPNGNSINPTNVEISNLGSLSGGGGSFSNSSSYYYQSTDGTNTIRVSKRMHTVVASGSHTTNGGVIVRVYFDPNEHIAMNSDAWPGGGTTIFSSWFKHSQHSDQNVVNDMTPMELLNADEITPIATGTESGVAYAEFLVSDFSTFGYISATVPIPLPLKLISFEVKNSECINNISWVTTNENQIDFIELEKSFNGKEFITINRQKSKGSEGLNNYSISDSESSKAAFYRLKINDLDGSFEYSKVIFSKPCLNRGSLVVYPNPVVNNLHIELKNEDTYSFRLFQSDGRMVSSGRLSHLNNVMDLSIFTSGVYYLVIFDSINNSVTYKLVKI